MTREIVKSIKEIKELSNDFEGKYYTIYAFFLRCVREKPTIWRLADSSDINGIEILISNLDEHFHRPQVGDIIRIHRLVYNQKFACPECIVTRNILIWSAFKKEPTRYSIARKYTYSESDEEKRKLLELEFYHTIHKIENIYAEPVSLTPTFINLAARIIDKQLDEKFGNVILRLVDGTKAHKPIENYYKLISNRTVPSDILQNSVVLLVYSKQNEKETSIHQKKALSASIGDYIYVSQVKSTLYPNNQLRLYLSANEEHHRAFRLIESESLIGLKIESECSRNFPSLQDYIKSSAPVSQPQVDPPEPIVSDSVSDTLRDNQTNYQSKNQPKHDNYKLSLIAPPKNNYIFLNLVARVVATKKIEPYNNHLLLVEDGSCFNYVGYLAHEFAYDADIDLTNKATILVYEKRFLNETDAHITVARELQARDYLHIVNAKISWHDQKLKIEVNANLDHGKSLKKIEAPSDLVGNLPVNSEPNFEECFEEPSFLGPVEE